MRCSCIARPRMPSPRGRHRSHGDAPRRNHSTRAQRRSGFVVFAGAQRRATRERCARNRCRRIATNHQVARGASMCRRWLRRRGRSAPRRSRIAARWVAIWPTPRPPGIHLFLLAYDAVVVTDRRAIPSIVLHWIPQDRAAARQLITRCVSARGRRVFRKSARARQAISKVVMAVSRHPARIAIGSVAEVPLRAHRAEAAVEEGDVEGAIAVVGEDVRPIDDVRSTAAYRRQVTQNVLRELLDARAGE